MSRRMNFDMTKETAGILILDSGEYEFTIVDVSIFERTRNNPDGTTDDIYGLRYKLSVDGNDQYDGKTIINDLYMHTPKTGSLNKAFVMAGHGYDVRNEAQFNDTFSDPSVWNIDWDEKVIGDAWKGVVGRKIKALVTRKTRSDDPNQEQNQFRWGSF